MTQEEYTDSMQKWLRNIKTHQTESWNGYEGQQEGFVLGHQEQKEDQGKCGPSAE